MILALTVASFPYHYHNTNNDEIGPVVIYDICNDAIHHYSDNHCSDYFNRIIHDVHRLISEKCDT